MENLSLYPLWHDIVFKNKEFYDLDLKIISPYLEKYGINVLDLALEIGPGSGLWLEWIRKKYPKLGLITLEKDPLFCSYLQKSKKSLMKNIHLVCGNAITRSHFSRHSFKFIFALRETLYHQNVSERQRMWENMYFWLQPGGFLFIHSLNPKKLNPGPQNFSQCYPGKNKELVCYTYFEEFIHMGSFYEKSENEKIYKERVQLLDKNKNGKIDKNKISLEVDIKHTLYIPTIENLEKEWEFNGFKCLEKIGLEKYWIPDISLIILYKPKSKFEKK